MLNYTYGTNGMKVPNDYLVNVWPTDIDNINNPEKDTKYQEYKKQVKTRYRKSKRQSRYPNRSHALGCRVYS